MNLLVREAATNQYQCPCALSQPKINAHCQLLRAHSHTAMQKTRVRDGQNIISHPSKQIGHITSMVVSVCLLNGHLQWIVKSIRCSSTHFNNGAPSSAPLGSTQLGTPSTQLCQPCPSALLGLPEKEHDVD